MCLIGTQEMGNFSILETFIIVFTQSKCSVFYFDSFHTQCEKRTVEEILNAIKDLFV